MPTVTFMSGNEREENPTCLTTPRRADLKIARQKYSISELSPMASNHGNLYLTLLALVLGRYGVPHAKANGTE